MLHTDWVGVGGPTHYCIDSICITQDHAMLESVGFHVSSDSENSSSDSEDCTSSGELYQSIPPGGMTEHLNTAKIVVCKSHN